VGICGGVTLRDLWSYFYPGREEHDCDCFLYADSSGVDGVSCCSEHGVFIVNGMADGVEPKKCKL
jgi:hypothetical protein